MIRKGLIENAVKQANVLEGLNPVAKSLYRAGNFSSKHPYATAALLGALTAKFGTDVARRLVFEGQNTVQSLTNPYYNSYGNYGGYQY